jgi:protein TonB
MYADRYGKPGIKPGALGIAVGLNSAIIAALIFSSPDIVKHIDSTFVGEQIPLPPEPPPIPDEKPELKPEIKIEQRTVTPPPPERPTTTDSPRPDAGGFTVDPGPTGLDGGVAGGTGTVLTPYVPPHVPVLVGARPDPRFARALQPDYPPGERRAEREGRVTVRVLVGIDGRVKQVELVSAASDQFFEATRRQALEKWRFTPATRDGIPEEAWRTMSVTFVLANS